MSSFKLLLIGLAAAAYILRRNAQGPDAGADGRTARRRAVDRGITERGGVPVRRRRATSARRAGREDRPLRTTPAVRL